MVVSSTVPMFRVRRNDLLAVQTAEGVGSWDRVISVDHEPGHPMRLNLRDGTFVVGDALSPVRIRRLVVLRGGALRGLLPPR